MPNDNEEIIPDTVGDTKEQLGEIIRQIRRAVFLLEKHEEERRRFDWLKFVSNVAGYIKGEIEKRMK